MKKTLAGFFISVAMVLNAVGTSAGAFPSLSAKPPSAPTESDPPAGDEKSMKFNFSLRLPEREKGDIAVGLDQLTIDYMLSQNGCKETDPAKFMKDWFEQQNVPVDIRTQPPLDSNGLSWFIIKPKDSKDQRAFDDLRDALDALTQLPNGRPFREKDIKSCGSSNRLMQAVPTS